MCFFMFMCLLSVCPRRFRHFRRRCFCRRCCRLPRHLHCLRHLCQRENHWSRTAPSSPSPRGGAGRPTRTVTLPCRPPRCPRRPPTPDNCTVLVHRRCPPRRCHSCTAVAAAAVVIVGLLEHTIIVFIIVVILLLFLRVGRNPPPVNATTTTTMVRLLYQVIGT